MYRYFPYRRLAKVAGEYPGSVDPGIGIFMIDHRLQLRDQTNLLRMGR